VRQPQRATWQRSRHHRHDLLDGARRLLHESGVEITEGLVRATGFTATDWYTYDANAKRWIDITVGSYGGYGYSTSTGWEHGHILWGADSFLPDGDVTSSTGTLITKISDTKLTTASAFTTTAGLLNRVTGTCTKH
jgi:hypothetical protein